MARPGGYGRMSNNRRGSGAVWQWLLLGSLFGFGCAAILVLTLLTFDILSISSNDDEGQPIAQATLPSQPTQSAPPTTQPLPTQNVQATVDAAINATSIAAQATTDAAQEADVPGEAVTVATAGITTQPDTATEEVQDPVADAGSAGTDPTQDTSEGSAEDIEQNTDGTAGGGGDGTDPTAVEETEESDEEAQAVDPELAAIRSQLVEIEGGVFNMGTTAQEVAAAVRECIDRDGGDCDPSFGEDATPQVTVTLSDFAIERTEVTNAQYIAFLNSLINGPAGLTHENGCNAPSGVLCIETSVENDLSSILFDGLNFAPSNPVINQLPVVGVTWYGAQAYCEAIGRRLPTEAEWEYAASSGSAENLYPWGQNWINAEDYARTSRPDPANIGVVQIGSYSPVGDSLQYGLVDMAGNAEEWVADWYGANWYSDPNASALDPTGPAAGRDKVLRGGSWAFVPFFTRNVQRRHRTPDWISFTAGFRCAADIEEEEPAVDAPVDGGSTGEVGTGDASTGGSEVESLATQAPAAGATIRPAATLELPATAEGTEEAAAVPPVQDGG